MEACFGWEWKSYFKKIILKDEAFNWQVFVEEYYDDLTIKW